MKQPNNWNKIALLFAFAAICFTINLGIQLCKAFS
jgi:hypothetical protein